MIDSIVLWNTTDLGYLTVYASNALVNGTLKAGDAQFESGHLGKLEIVGDEVRLRKTIYF